MSKTTMTVLRKHTPVRSLDVSDALDGSGVLIDERFPDTLKSITECVSGIGVDWSDEIAFERAGAKVVITGIEWESLSENGWLSDYVHDALVSWRANGRAAFIAGLMSDADGHDISGYLRKFPGLTPQRTLRGEVEMTMVGSNWVSMEIEFYRDDIGLGRTALLAKGQFTLPGFYRQTPFFDKCRVVAKGDSQEDDEHQLAIESLRAVLTVSSPSSAFDFLLKLPRELQCLMLSVEGGPRLEAVDLLRIAHERDTLRENIHAKNIDTGLSL